MIILDNDYAKAEFVEEGNYILFEYRKFLSSERLREYWRKVAEVAIEKKVSKWLSDSRKMAIVAPEDQKWLSEELNPKMIGAVQKDVFAAVVLDDSIFGNLTVKAVVTSMQAAEKNDITYTVEHFKNVDAARTWIENVEHQLEPLER